jgi:hypothetical protein
MSAEHKAKLAQGRNDSRAVRSYLEALDAYRPKRGRKRTPDSVKKRLDDVDAELAEADALSRLVLVQERMDLESELAAMDDKVDLTEYEDAFVDAALRYSQSKGISYAAWREVGVAASVLKRAGITRSM